MAPRAVGGLSVRVGTDLSALAEDLADGLSRPLGPVLERELVIVPTPGVGAWLEGRLARRLGAGARGDGICANVAFRLAGDLLRRLDRTRDPDLDEWSVESMTVGALGTLLHAGPEDPVARLRGPDDPRGAFAVARAAADLFDQLFRWRPDVADRWLAGDDEDRRAALLRSIASRATSPPPHVSLRTAIERLRSGDDGGLDLPLRVHLFGADTLAGGPSMPDALDALASVREVRVHLVVPSVARFEALRRATPAFTGRAPDRHRGEEPGDPLLRSWGTASGDAARLVAQLPARLTTAVEQVASGDDATPSSLLGALQRTITTGPARRAADRSVSLHGCVGPLRQVEVVRDAILHALADDRTLAPSDVAILCTDLPRFAPYLEAVLADPQGAPRLPFVVRDRAVSRAVPLVAALDTALGLLAGRVARSDLLDFLRLESVRRRFALDAEDVDRIAEWSAATDVRWGLDGAHRAPTGLPATFDAGTWRRSLDRLVAGAAIPSGLVTAPLGLRAVDVGHSLERVGALCDLVDALAALRARATSERTVVAWCDFAREVADAFLAPAPQDTRAPRQLDELLEGVAGSAWADATPLPFHEFRALLSDRAAQVRDLVVTGPGGVTVTSLVPLRHVPFRVVAILGLDEPSLERARAVDVAFGPTRVGDRDPRTELRATLLAAVLAARDRLVVTFDARDLVSNEDVAPATVLVELREAIARACDGDPSSLERLHPRHAHGDGDLLVERGPFSFDGGAHRRALELRAPLRDEDAIRPRVEPPATPPERRVSLLDLRTFLRAPQRTYLGTTLGVRIPPRPRTPDDELPTSLDNLERWRAVEMLTDEALGTLDHEIDDATWGAFVATWASRPDGPLASLPGRLAERALHGPDGVAARSRALRDQVEVARGEGDWERVPVELAVGDDVLVGEVDVFGGSRCVGWTPSASDHRLLIDATLDALVLTVLRPETRWRGYRVFRGTNGRVRCDTFAVPGADPAERQARAVAALGALLDLRRRGLETPLPLFFHVTMAMHARLQRTLVPAELLAYGLTNGWTPFHGGGDGRDDSVRYCFDASYEELAALRTRPTDPSTRLDAAGSRLLTYSFALLESLCLLDDLELAP